MSYSDLKHEHEKRGKISCNKKISFCGFSIIMVMVGLNLWPLHGRVYLNHVTMTERCLVMLIKLHFAMM